MEITIKGRYREYSYDCLETVRITLEHTEPDSDGDIYFVVTDENGNSRQVFIDLLDLKKVLRFLTEDNS